jgi:hypothetical protein
MDFPETFSILCSLRIFLVETIAGAIGDIPVFLNPILLPHEKERLPSLSHYLRVEVTPGEVNWEQPVDVSFRLWMQPEFDPSLLWLLRTPYHIIQKCLERKTDPALNMIAVYDFDRLVGEAALKAFYEQGIVPSTLPQLLTKRFPDVSYYERRGLRIGLKALANKSSPRFDYDTLPLSATWVMTFRYFEPAHQNVTQG